MKLCGLIGSNAEFSYNRQLLEFMKNHFADQVEIELAEIKDIPLFNQDNDLTKSREIQDLNQKILNADGVIISTPEHNHTIMPALKSVLEWLSFKINPLIDKPVMIVGASYDDQGSSRAQLHLRQILDSPGINALVLPGNEFLLGKVKEAFDEKGNLKDEKAVAFLESILQKFLKFVKMVTTLETPTPPILKPEDLNATGKIASTVEGIEMNADDWVEQAAQKVEAVEGQTYVKLNRGLLTVEQIDCLLNSMPMEITFVDSNNQFLYYNNALANEEMLAARRPEQVGSPLAKFHPERTHKNVEHVIQLLRSGQLDVLRVHTPKVKNPDKYPVHSYQAMRDQNGHYLGINEYSLDFKPVVEWYLKQTGQRLIADNRNDDVSGASRKD